MGAPEADAEALRRRYDERSTGELLVIAESDGLTPTAVALLKAELARRGLEGAAAIETAQATERALRADEARRLRLRRVLATFVLVIALGACVGVLL